jgi:predicted DNA-binding transcriptional regulator YafY
MTKAERLLNLVTYMRSRRTAITASELADRLEVSERTIYRDIQSLMLTGIPIEGEAGVGYLLNSETSIAPLMFSESEIEALVLGMRLVKSCGDNEIIQQADSALTKIRSVISEPMMHRLNHKATPFLVPEYGRENRVKFGEEIRSAIQKKKSIVIRYTDNKQAESERELEPLGLVFWGASWTLAAWCLMRQDYRSFRLDRIIELTLTERDTAPNEHNLQSYLASQGEQTDTHFWAI